MRRKPDPDAPRGERIFGYTKFRRAWMTGHRLDVALYTGLPSNDEKWGFVDDSRSFGADSVVIEIRRGKRVIFIDFTSLTEEELTMFRELLNLAIDTAMPAARYIDKAAQEATEADETFSPRPFRIRPVMHIPRWDKTITIPDNYQEYKNEQARSNSGPDGPPPVEGPE